jgi:hypothetical protein
LEPLHPAGELPGPRGNRQGIGFLKSILNKYLSEAGAAGMRPPPTQCCVALPCDACEQRLQPSRRSKPIGFGPPISARRDATSVARPIPAPETFPRLLSHTRAEPSGVPLDDVAVRVDGNLGRIEAWTPAGSESLAPAERPKSARLVKGRWLSTRML